MDKKKLTCENKQVKKWLDNKCKTCENKWEKNE